MAISSGSQIEELLGDEAESLLSYQASGIDAAQIVAPGPDFIDRVVVQTDRTPPVLRNLGTLTNTGRLSGTGRSLSIITRSMKSGPGRCSWLRSMPCAW